MEFGKTGRGFENGKFKDSNDVECSIQVSSAVREESLIWLGANDIGLQRLESNQGWVDVELEQTQSIRHTANTRMHLTQSKVKELLPILQRFAETGELSKY